MRNIFALLSGSLFGAGLLIAGVTDTRTIHGWLDLSSNWDPTLGFFFAGSAIVMAIGWRVAMGRNQTALKSPLPEAPSPKLDRGLVAGSLMFGVGWGLTGICPGPSMAALSFGGASGMIFFTSMVAGMLMAVPIKKLIAMRNTQLHPGIQQKASVGL